MKKIALLLLLLLLSTHAPRLISAEPGILTETKETILYRQFDGKEVLLNKHPQRTIITFGSLVSVWYCAGGTAIAIPQIRSKTTIPPEARELPTIGGYSSMNSEKILELRPDLVIMTNRSGTHEQLRKLLNDTGIQSLSVKYNNYHDFQNLIDLFCRLNGTDPTQCPAVKQVTDQVEQIVKASQALPPTRFATLFAQANGFSIESNHANASYMLTMLGGKNIAESKNSTRNAFSIEQLLVADPDVIFVVTMGDSQALEEKFRRDIMSQPAWQKLRAHTTGRVHFLPSDLYLYLAGPRFPEAFRNLARLLHPEQEFN